MGILDVITKLKIGLIKGIDVLNSMYDPHQEFTRPLMIPPNEDGSNPEERLAKLADHFEEDLIISRFVSEDKTLFVQEIPADMGDLCVWQSVYTGMSMLARKAIKDPEMDTRAKAAIEGFMKYTNPRLFRGVAPIEGFDSKYRMDPSRQQLYFKIGSDWILEDPSLDSLGGWLYGAAMTLRYGLDVITDRIVLDRMATFVNQFIKDRYLLTNRNGKVTTYGNCYPGLIQAPVRNMAAAAVCKIGEYLAREYGIKEASNDKWKKIADECGNEFDSTETHVLWKHGWYNDHIAFLVGAAYCALDLDGDPAIGKARKGLRRLVDKHSKVGNPFFIYTSNLLGVPVMNEEKALADKVLLEFSLSNNPPNGKTKIETIRSSDPNLKTVKWGGKIEAAQPLPAWYRPAMDVTWQRNPYILDDFIGAKSSWGKFSGLDYLVAYYSRMYPES